MGKLIATVVGKIARKQVVVMQRRLKRKERKNRLNSTCHARAMHARKRIGVGTLVVILCKINSFKSIENR